MSFDKPYFRHTYENGSIYSIRYPQRYDIGLDGIPYAIYDSLSNYAPEYADLIGETYLGHWDGYENCVPLQVTIGM